MTKLCAAISISSFILLSNALSARDFFTDNKCKQQGANQNDLLVKIHTGCIEGTRIQGTRVFRGIPYASPPLKNLRWRPPQVHKPWDSTLKTMDFRSTCFQTVSTGYGNKTHPPEGMWPSIQGVNDMSEDCLFLNVMTPSLGSYSQCTKGCDFDTKQPYPHPGVCFDNKNISCSCLDSPHQQVCGPPITKPSKGFPVMVYIHAGEFQYGSSNDLESNKPPQLPTDVVLVDFNYRLGAFGYLGADALRGLSPSGSTGNYGQQDQRFALEWVQRNIKQFGGDPDNVMLFGESSGGTSVAWHLYSEMSRGLFHKAVLESPGLGQTHTMEESSVNFAFMLGEMANNDNLTLCNFDAGVWQKFNYQITTSGKYLHSVNVSSVKEAEQLCERDVSCKGFEYPTQRQPGQVFEARFSNKYMLPYYNRDSSYTSQLKGMSMARHNFGNIRKCLWSAPASLIAKVDEYVPISDTIVEDQWAPVVDGVETVMSLEQAIQTQSFPTRGVPVLLGSNLDEGSTFMFDCPALRSNATAAEFSEWSIKFAGLKGGVVLPKLYAPQTLEYPHPVIDSAVPDDENFYLSAVRAAGDRSISCPTFDLGRRLSRAGNAVYSYSFLITPNSSVNAAPSSMRALGAFHGAEVPFVFGDPSELVKPAERKVAAVMGCYWTNFAWNSHPNNATGRTPLYSQKLCDKLPSWEHTTQPEFRRIVFNITDEDARIDMVPADALTHSRCGFWAEME